MIDAESFTAGMQGIAAGVRKVWEAESLGVYFDALNCQTDPTEWEAFVRWVNRQGKWQWLPTLREVIDGLRDFRGAEPLLAEATRAYERVLKSGTYTPEGGTSWNYRAVRDGCGAAAAEAFLAAGGSAGFATTWDETKRRDKFVEQYSEAVRESPSMALLPEGPKLLSAATGPLGQREAVKILRGVGEKIPTHKIKRRMVQLTEVRSIELERQKAQILEQK